MRISAWRGDLREPVQRHRHRDACRGVFAFGVVWGHEQQACTIAIEVVVSTETFIQCAKRLSFRYAELRTGKHLESEDLRNFPRLNSAACHPTDHQRSRYLLRRADRYEANLNTLNDGSSFAASQSRGGEITNPEPWMAAIQISGCSIGGSGDRPLFPNWSMPRLRILA